MTRKLFDESTSRALLEFTAMFDALTPEYRNSLVMRALRARDHVSTDAGRALDSAIRGSIRLVGYSNPALAISSALLEPVNASIVKSEKLAGSALRVWAESMDELEKLVAGHLASQGLPTEYPDFENNRFRGFWDEEIWQRELDWIVDIAELWSEEDVALMLCYVSGRTIVYGDEGDLEEPEEPFIEISSAIQTLKQEEEDGARAPEAPAPVVEPPPVVVRPPAAVVPQPPLSARTEFDGPTILNQCMEFLSSLSPEDRNWTDAVPAFVEAVSGIRTLKSAQRERRASLLEAHTQIIQEFESDLEFLEQDTSFWSVQSLTELVDLDRTLDLAANLKDLLNEYRDVRRPGNTLSEELGRRERRFALEPRIIDSMGLMRQAMSGNRGRENPDSHSQDASSDNSEPPGLSHNGRPSSAGPDSNGDRAMEEMITDLADDNRLI